MTDRIRVRTGELETFLRMLITGEPEGKLENAQTYEVKSRVDATLGICQVVECITDETGKPSYVCFYTKPYRK